MVVEPFTYASALTPARYVCKTCQARGVRLYRHYSSSHIELLCTACTQKEQGEPLAQRGHSCGWRVAAVPTEDGQDWWGFTSVPDEGVLWWDGLPVKEGSQKAKANAHYRGLAARAYCAGMNGDGAPKFFAMVHTWYCGGTPSKSAWWNLWSDENRHFQRLEAIAEAIAEAAEGVK